MLKIKDFLYVWYSCFSVRKQSSEFSVIAYSKFPRILRKRLKKIV